MSSISRSISILFYVLFLNHISEAKSGETFAAGPWVDSIREKDQS
jgi:hypothetical protein